MLQLPTSEQVKSFTQEQIESLPSVPDVLNLPKGSFGKLTWRKAKSSLVFITRNEVVEGTGCSFAYVQCNPFNGHVATQEWASSAYLREYAYGDKHYELQSKILQPVNI